jgi:hypothetical protein
MSFSQLSVTLKRSTWQAKSVKVRKVTVYDRTS